jgi:hypothetical protein
MRIFDCLKLLVSQLNSEPIEWAIAGGVAACIYRSEPRYTGDIDIIISPRRVESDAALIAEGVLKRLGYKPILGFIAGEKIKTIGKPSLIAAREDTKGSFVGIDLILPVLPWVGPAIVRAQANKIDYGFGYLPTITPEDLVIAKLSAIQDTPDRPYDRDDIVSVCKNSPNLDRVYIVTQVSLFQIEVPTDLRSVIKL